MEKEIIEKAKNGGLVLIDKTRLWTSIIVLIIAVVLSQVIIATTWKATIDQKVTNHIEDLEIHQSYQSKIEMFVTRKEFEAYKRQLDNISNKVDKLYLIAIDKK